MAKGNDQKSGLQETDVITKKGNGFMTVQVQCKSGIATYTHFTSFKVLVDKVDESRILKDVNRQTRTDAVNSVNRQSSPLAQLKNHAREALVNDDTEAIKKIEAGLEMIGFRGTIHDLAGMKKAS
jgi:hypothetical protein